MKITKSILLGIGFVAALAAVAVNVPGDRSAPVGTVLAPVAHDSTMSSIRTIKAAVPLVTVARVDSSAIAERTDSSLPRLAPLLLLPFLFGAVKTVAPDRDTKPPLGDSVRIQHNLSVADIYYFFLHRPAWQVAAAAVAPPVCARGTTASKVKTTATTQLFVNGIVKSLTATDDLWTLTGGNLAAGFFRRYLLCWDGASGTTVVSVIASSDAATKAGCLFPNLPAQGVAIVGILTIQNVTNPFIPGTTLLSAAGVTDTYVDGFEDVVLQSGQVTQ